MAISIYLIKKWTKMVLGRSQDHVNQTEGRAYSITQLSGYYNNLTEKVSRYARQGDEVPMYNDEKGNLIYFSIGIFQYGLAAYDLFLLNRMYRMLDKVRSCAEWAVNNQHEDGAWGTFRDDLYSSMAQGEGISLLVRAYKQFGDERYKKSAILAKQFILKDMKLGGGKQSRRRASFALRIYNLSACA